MAERIAGGGGAPRRWVVLSDMHFGTAETSINVQRWREALVRHLVARAPWEEIVLTGDLLDVNLATLTRAIEGRRRVGRGTVCGFRQFLAELDAAMAAARPGARLPDLAARWVYVPGNHDYAVWDLLATQVACLDVLRRGDRLRPGRTPLAAHAWPEGDSFFAGIFRPFGAHAQVSVEYPDHVVAFGPGADRMVFTHGHYLDPSQTRGHDLSDNLARAAEPARARATVRQIVIETAQYQAVAHAVSFTEDAKRLVSDLVGPDGWVHKLHRLGERVATALLALFIGRDGALRGKALSGRMLRNVDCYLDRFRAYAPRPRWFVFGHTHAQGRRTTPAGVDAVNAGSCYPDHGRPITFAEVEVGPGGDQPAVTLMAVHADGAVRPSA